MRIPPSVLSRLAACALAASLAAPLASLAPPAAAQPRYEMPPPAGASCPEFRRLRSAYALFNEGMATLTSVLTTSGSCAGVESLCDEGFGQIWRSIEDAFFFFDVNHDPGRNCMRCGGAYPDTQDFTDNMMFADFAASALGVTVQPTYSSYGTTIDQLDTDTALCADPGLIDRATVEIGEGPYPDIIRSAMSGDVSMHPCERHARGEIGNQGTWRFGRAGGSYGSRHPEVDGYICSSRGYRIFTGSGLVQYECEGAHEVCTLDRTFRAEVESTRPATGTGTVYEFRWGPDLASRARAHNEP